MAEALGWDGIDRPARTVCGDRSPRRAYGEGNSYGTGWTLVGNQKPDDGTGQYQNRSAEEPAQSITTQADRYRWELHGSHREKVNDRTQPRGLDEPALTIAFGHSDMRWVREQDSVRITAAEAAALQSFRPDYPWHGTKTSVFGQIGNAVPPVLAAAVLAQLTARATAARRPVIGGAR
jgi:DNA (cytosine-5)-methyltransferase 1